MLTRQVAVVSGKGGTGKTSIAASLAALGRPLVLAGCDIGAPELEMLTEPRSGIRVPFAEGQQARAGRLEPAVTGAWFLSETRFGPMVHAFLPPGEGVSGELVSTVRAQACMVAADRGLSLVVVDGAAGVGCPVIASLRNVDLALVVTEATLSGLHDASRVLRLAAGMGVETALCVNRWDLDPEVADRVEAEARTLGATVVARVREDAEFVASQLRGEAVVERSARGAAADLACLWDQVRHRLFDAPAADTQAPDLRALQAGRPSSGRRASRTSPARSFV
jgi:MinD superfamily P-loop ATPase